MLHNPIKYVFETNQWVYDDFIGQSGTVIAHANGFYHVLFSEWLSTPQIVMYNEFGAIMLQEESNHGIIFATDMNRPMKAMNIPTLRPTQYDVALENIYEFEK